MQLSFGMLFSIMLIIIFIIFAFYTINIFLGTQKDLNFGKLFNDVQRDVDKIWRSTESLKEFEYVIPKEIDRACFIDFGPGARLSGPATDIYNDLGRISSRQGNFVLYSIKDSDGYSSRKFKDIEHIDIGETTSSENPLCFEVSNGKIKITLRKDFGRSEVIVVK